MATSNIRHVEDEKNLEVKLFIDDREVFKIECVNIVHFYVICFAVKKFEQGEAVDAILFSTVKRS